MPLAKACSYVFPFLKVEPQSGSRNIGHAIVAGLSISNFGISLGLISYGYLNSFVVDVIW